MEGLGDSLCLALTEPRDGRHHKRGRSDKLLVQAEDGFRQAPRSLRTSILVAMTPLYRSSFVSSEGKAPKTYWLSMFVMDVWYSFGTSSWDLGDMFKPYPYHNTHAQILQNRHENPWECNG